MKENEMIVTITDKGKNQYVIKKGSKFLIQDRYNVFLIHELTIDDISLNRKYVKTGNEWHEIENYFEDILILDIIEIVI
jgi:hypothetical protein